MGRSHYAAYSSFSERGGGFGEEDGRGSISTRRSGFDSTSQSFPSSSFHRGRSGSSFHRSSRHRSRRIHHSHPFSPSAVVRRRGRLVPSKGSDSSSRHRYPGTRTQLLQRGRRGTHSLRYPHSRFLFRSLGIVVVASLRRGGSVDHSSRQDRLEQGSFGKQTSSQLPSPSSSPSPTDRG